MCWATSNRCKQGFLWGVMPLALACCLGLLLSGCGKQEFGIVEGKVTLDGKPLTNASIVFEDANRGISVNAPLAASGTFKVQTFDKPGLPPGNYRVAIRPGTVGSGAAPLVGDVDPSADAKQISVPERYRSVKTSGLSAKVELGANSPFAFSLTTQQKP